MKRMAITFCFTIVATTIAAPATANEFDHVWRCELKSGKSLDDARAVALDWLAAARSMKNGAQLQSFIHYPIVVSGSENRFDFIVRAPSLTAWGAFYDSYDDDTPVAAADAKFAAVARCSGSTMWELIKVE